MNTTAVVDPTSKQNLRRPLLALITGAICIGFAPVFAKHAVNFDVASDGSRLSPVAVACWRMIIAAPFFALGSISAHGRPLGGRRQAWRRSLADALWLMLPGLCFALDLAAWHTSFEYTSVANATLLANLAAVVVALVSWFAFGERFGLMFVAGTALALVGMTGLLGASFASASEAWIGDLLGLFVALAYAGYQLSTKYILKRHNVRIVMTWSTVFAGIFLAIAALPQPGRFTPVTLVGWIDVIALALLSQVMGQGFIAFGMSQLPASFSSVTLIVQPVCAAFFGWLMLAQPLSWIQGLCGAIVLAGIYLAKRGSRIN